MIDDPDAAPMRRILEYDAVLRSQAIATWGGFRAEVNVRAIVGPTQVRMVPRHHVILLTRRAVKSRAVMAFDDERERKVVNSSGSMHLVAAGSELRAEILSAQEESAYAALFIDPATASDVLDEAGGLAIARSAYRDGCDPVGETIEAIAREVEQSAPFGRLYLDGLSSVLLAQLGRHLRGTPAASEAARGALRPASSTG